MLRNFLKKCLASIYQYIDISGYEIIVIDNGLTDSLMGEIENYFGQQRIILASELLAPGF